MLPTSSRPPTAGAKPAPPPEPLEIRARGDAMAPLVRPGDRVRLARRTPRVGEIGLVSVGGRLILQRLVRHRGDTWQVHADRAGAPDAWIHGSQIVAIATERLRVGDAGWRALGPPRRPTERLRDSLLGSSEGR
jgi:hypothetical protein